PARTGRGPDPRWAAPLALGLGPPDRRRCLLSVGRTPPPHRRPLEGTEPARRGAATAAAIAQGPADAGKGEQHRARAKWVTEVRFTPVSSETGGRGSGVGGRVRQSHRLSLTLTLSPDTRRPAIHRKERR